MSGASFTSGGGGKVLTDETCQANRLVNIGFYEWLGGRCDAGSRAHQSNFVIAHPA
jgi:hypothetical protein